MKQCKKCSEIKAVTEFHKRAGTNDGLQLYCKSCQKQHHRNYVQAHSDERKTKSNQYYQDNRERIATYHKTNSLRRATYMRQYGIENYKRLLENHRQYQREHPWINREAVRRYIARKLGLSGEFTEDEFFDLYLYYLGRCFYCDIEVPYERVSRDHMIPVTRKGSTNYIDNIVPTCRSCNSAKGSKTIEEFMCLLVGV